MIEPLNENDINKYNVPAQHGELSHLDLSEAEMTELKNMIMRENRFRSDYTTTSEGVPQTKQTVTAICKFIHKHHERETNQTAVSENKFQRDGNQVNSGTNVGTSGGNGVGCTGCTDYALLYVGIARQLGLSATFLQTTEKDHMEQVTKGKANEHTAAGHAFSETYVDGEWILVDPTKSRITKNYDPNSIHLAPFHNVAGKKDFIAYERGQDYGQKQTVQEYVEKHNQTCIALGVEKGMVSQEDQEKLNKKYKITYTPKTKNLPGTSGIIDMGQEYQTKQNEHIASMSK